MKRKPSVHKYILFAFLFFLSIFCLGQSQTITITGPSQATGPITVTLEINPPATCSVSLLPASLTIDTGNTQQFTATGTGCSPNTFTYQVNGVTGGDATHGTISVSGLYTAPASVPSPATVTVTAISGDPSAASASSSVTIVTPPPPCSASIVPTSASVLTNGTQQFTATTIGCSPSTVTWQVNSITGGNSTIGTISNTGLYTAPANVPTPNSVSVCAVSNQVGGPSACATVTISAPLVCNVSLVPIGGMLPIVVTLNVNATQQFTAIVTNCSPSTVTWSVNGINGGNSTVGTVSGSGLYTAPASVPSPNSVTVTVTSNADSTKNASATVIITTPSISLNDSGCSQGNIPTWGTTDHGAGLPRTCYYTNPSVIKPNPTGTDHLVSSSLSVSAAWSAAACGDTITLPVGFVAQNVSLASKPCPGPYYTVIRSAGYANLPTYGTKLTPCYAGISNIVGRPPLNCAATINQMAVMETTTANAAFTMGANSTFWEIEGIEIRNNTSNVNFVNLLTNVSAGGISHYVFYHNWLHGYETNVAEIHNGISVNNTSWGAVIDNFFDDLYCVQNGACTDAHSVGGGTNGVAGCTDNTFKIVDNFMEATGQSTVLMGGSSASCTPSDIEIRLNIGWKSFTWDTLCTSAVPCPGNVIFTGIGPAQKLGFVKNLLELKNAQYVLIEGNSFNNNWAGDADQNGPAILITPKNQAAGTSNLCPNCFTQNITIRYNVIEHACYPNQISNVPNGNGAYALLGNTYSHHDNVYTNMEYTNGGKSCSGNPLAGQRISQPGGPSTITLKNVYDQHNTYILSPTVTANPVDGQFSLSGPMITSTGSATWTAVNLPSTATTVDGFDIRQSNNEWYIADRIAGHYYKTLNQGATWTDITSNIPTGTGISALSIQVNPNDGSLIAGGGNVVKFWRSTNDGASWTQLVVTNFAANPIDSITGCSMPFASGGNLNCGGYFSTAGHHNFYSTDNGVTGTLSIFGGTPPGGTTSIGRNPLDGSIWVGTEAAGEWRSADGGAHFTQVFACISGCGGGTNGNMYGITFDTAGDPILAAQGGIYKGSGSGFSYTFTKTFSFGNQARGLGIDANGVIYGGHNGTTGSNSAYRSTDNGNSFQPFVSGLPSGLDSNHYTYNTNDSNMYAVFFNDSTNVGSIYHISTTGGGTTGSKITAYDWRNSIVDYDHAAMSGISNPSDGCTTGNVNCACGLTTPIQILNACVDFNTTSFFAGEMFIGTNTYAHNNWPGTNCFGETSNTNAFVNFNNGLFLGQQYGTTDGDFHVKNTSTCHNSGTDGLDPGADITTLLSKIGQSYHF